MSDKVAVSGEEEILSASAPFELQQLLWFGQKFHP